MKFTEFITDKKTLSFLGGMFAATYGVKALKSDKTRKVCVNSLAKCMKLGNEAKETLKNMKEDAEDICYDAKQAAEE